MYSPHTHIAGYALPSAILICMIGARVLVLRAESLGPEMSEGVRLSISEFRL